MKLPFAIDLLPDSALVNHTGSWRTQRPVYVTREAPCITACPAGEDPRAWLYLAETGDYEPAWRALVERNPLPAVMGRICFAPCEVACNRASLDDAVGINSVERFLGDFAIECGWALPTPAADTGRRVLVVGSGPAGLAGAYHLRLAGHAVTLVEASAHLGGMLRYGIPAYRLPREVLDTEIARILDLGVTVLTDHPVRDLLREMADGGYDAALLAVGAPLGKRVDIPAVDASRIIDAVGYLREVAEGAWPQLGRRVVVYGGGDTAMDAARTAKRLGAEPTILYRRTHHEMPAHTEEVDAAFAEGIQMHWLSTVQSFEDDHLVIERMELVDGLPVATGQFETLGADALVLALGQDTDLSLLAGFIDSGHVNALVPGPGMSTEITGVFAAGDVTSSPRSATVAAGHGRRAAGGIDAFLSGTTTALEDAPAPATFEHLNPWYYADAERQLRDELDIVRRQSSFEEVVHGLGSTNALFEARRCLSCGSCFGCDNCFGVCPDNAIIKLAEGKYEINYDYCKGCGICVTECPAGAIELVPETV